MVERVVGAGQEQVPQPTPARLELQVLDHRWHMVSTAPSFQLGTLRGIYGLRRVEVAVHELLQTLKVLSRLRAPKSIRPPVDQGVDRLYLGLATR